MNGFGGVSSVTQVGARGLTQAAILNAKSPTPKQAVEYLIGMLVENNDYISKEITNGYNTFDENNAGSVATYQMGPYLVHVGVFANYGMGSQGLANDKNSAVHITFDTPLKTTSKAIIDLPKLLQNFRVALYNHKTGLMSHPQRLDKFTQIYLTHCVDKPYPSKETVEENYPASGLENERFALSLVVFDPNENLITPGLVR